MVFDGNAATRDEMAAQWTEFHAVMRHNNSLPVHYCLGNHDLWGLTGNLANRRDREYGKQWALETLGMSSEYYSFDHSGWHFIALDSVKAKGRGYIGDLGRDQRAWLESDLQTHTNKPTLVMSHIPLLSACTAFFGRAEEDGRKWHIHGGLMHIDARHTKDLFLQHPNVRVSISGHIHLVDRVDYNAVSYLCNGAVSGNWWKGTFQETPPGYVLMDLFDDGTWRREYIKYGWTPEV